MTHRNRTLLFETLDERLPLAGNVHALMSNGLLTISAGDLDNMVAVWGGANAGQVTVAGAGQTTVNGSASNKSFSGVTAIRFNLQGGNDQALVTRLNLAGGVGFEGGNGNDRLLLRGEGPTSSFPPLNQGTIPFGPLEIQSVNAQGSAGDDTLNLVSAKVRDLLYFAGGSGGDQVQVDGAKSANQFGRVELHMEAGNDQVNFRSAAIKNPTAQDVALGIYDEKGAEDTGTSAKAELYNVSVTGRAFVTLTNYATMYVRLGGAAANTGFTTTDTVRVAGNDIGLKFINSPVIQAHGSIGVDQVLISESQANRLNVHLKGGNDKLTMRNVTTNVSTVLDGGEGTDWYLDAGGNSLADVQNNFEPPPQGSVTVTQDAAGKLNILGSNKYETLVVSSGANPGDVILRGAGTTINGSFSQTFSGVTALSFDMGTNDDRVLITKFHSSAPIEFNGGIGGNENFLLVQSTPPAEPFAFLNDGEIQYGPVSAHSLNVVNADVRIVNASFNGGVSAELGTSDKFEVDGDVAKNVFTGGASGYALEVRTGEFSDGSIINIKHASIAGLFVSKGDIRVENVVLTDDSLIEATGNVTAFYSGRAVLQHVTGTSLQITAQVGSDELVLRDVDLDTLALDAKEGRDILRAANVTTHVSTKLIGGDGVDRYFDEGGNDYANLEFDFEETITGPPAG